MKNNLKLSIFPLLAGLFLLLLRGGPPHADRHFGEPLNRDGTDNYPGRGGIYGDRHLQRPLQPHAHSG